MLAALYDRVGSAAYSLAVRIIGDRASAEDVVAAVLSTVYEAPGSGPGVEDRAASRVLHLVRSRSLTHRDASRPGGRGAATREIPGATTGGDGPPLSEVELARLREAAATLPEVTRRAIELVFFDGLTQADLSVHLDLPEAAARRVVHEGLVTLRDEARRHR